MRWPWRRGRRGGARIVFLGRDGLPSAPGSVQPAGAPSARDGQPPASPRRPPAVQLGFRDGSTLALDADDPAALALRKAADALTSDSAG